MASLTTLSFTISYANYKLHDWLGTIADPATDKLVHLRNDLNHGGMPSASWAEDNQGSVNDWLALFVTVAATRPAPRTVVAGKLEHTGQEFVADVASLNGNATTVGWERLNVSEPLLNGHVYLIADDGPPVDLWPLILGEQADRPGQWNVSVLTARQETIDSAICPLRTTLEIESTPRSR